MAFHNSLTSVVYDEIIFHVELNISVVQYISAASVVNDQTTRNTHSWKCFSHVILKINVVSAVSGEITFFHVVSKINVVSVASGHDIFYEVSKISVVSLVSDEVVFHIVMNICVVSVVIIKLCYI